MVTGVAGFVGQHLAHELQQSGHEVVGVGTSPLKDTQLKNKLGSYYACDLTKAEDVAKLPLNQMDGVINLAGLANVGESYNQADLYQKVNVGIVDTLAKQILELGLNNIRLIIVSTGTVYDPLQKAPFDENAQLANGQNVNPYIQSKLAIEKCALEYRSSGLDCIIARPFNHIGPGQKPGFLVPDLARQLEQTHASGQTEISVGDLSKERDFTDVRDVVKAYRLLVTAPKHQLSQPIYNICSGQPHNGRELLNLLMESMGLGSIKVTVDPSRLRPNDPQSIYGNAQLITKDTGWKPEISLAQTINDFVSWRAS